MRRKNGAEKEAGPRVTVHEWRRAPSREKCCSRSGMQLMTNIFACLVPDGPKVCNACLSACKGAQFSLLCVHDANSTRVLNDCEQKPNDAIATHIA